MNTETLRALEFDAILEMLRRRARSTGGRLVVSGLRPSADLHQVRAVLQRTSQAVRLLESLGPQPYEDIPGVEQVLLAANAMGGQLDPGSLLAITELISLSVDVASAVRRCEDAPQLASLAETIRDLTPVAAEIRRSISPDGEVADDASPRLAELRRFIREARATLQAVMDSFLSDPDCERHLQERLITSRNDRYVLMVKAECRSQVPGIIHGASGSGASLFVEPLRALDLNNDIVALMDAEQREIVRILKDLTARTRECLPDLENALQVLTQLDALQAMAILARDMQAVAPQIGQDLDLRDARHPLLLADLVAPPNASSAGNSMQEARVFPKSERQGAAREPVPVSLRISADSPVLIISGPNTGGKTVALKTIGLLALMAQSGLHIPAAAGSVLPVFRRIYADIGDEQSIVADQSTFSAHLATIVHMVRDISLPALILLDEMGSGTDPLEGGALGVAVLEHFRRAGAMVAATTHHGTIKDYAQSTQSVACASFGFDPDTYQPNYRLTFGAPGRSLAFEMAERLGLPASLLIEARSRLDRHEVEVIDRLTRLARQEKEMEALRQRLHAEQDVLDRERAELMQMAEDLERNRKRAIAHEISLWRKKRDDALLRADAEIRQAVLRMETAQASFSGRAAKKAKSEVHAVLARVDDELVGEDSQTEIKASGDIVIGDRVRIAPLGVTGALTAWVSYEEAEVAVAGKRLRVRRKDLERLEKQGRAGSGFHGSTGVAHREMSPEVKLVGMTIEEALPMLEKALDNAILSEITEIRVVHGTGRLRHAVLESLATHPQVMRVRAVTKGIGGGAGASIVEMKD